MYTVQIRMYYSAEVTSVDSTIAN